MKRRITCGSWMLGAAWAIACSHAPVKPTDKLDDFSEAQRLMERGQVQQAYTLLSPLLDAHPADLAIARTLTEAAFRAGQLPAVNQRFQSMLAGEFAGIGHYGLALAAVASSPSGKAEALEHFAAAERALPREADIPYRIGLVYMLAGEFESAEAALTRASQLAPRRADILVAYATCLDERGRGDEAMEGLRRLQGLELAPRLARKVLLLSARMFDPVHRAPPDVLPDLKKTLELLQQEALQQALRNVSDLLVRHPDLAIVQVLRGLAHSRLDNSAEAIVAFERALQLSDREPLAWMGLGDVYLRLEKWSKARDCYEKALAINPFDLNVHLRMGELAMQRGDYARAVLAYETLTSLEPEQPAHRHRLGQALFGAGRLESAADVYQGLLDANGGDLEALIRLGQLQLSLAARQPADRQRLRDRAKELLERARELAPDNQAVLEMLAQLED